MPRPSVQIFQQVLNTIVTPADPDLATCIVGPAYDYREYPADRSKDSSNSYFGPHPDTPRANVAVDGLSEAKFSGGGTEMEVPLAFPAGGQNFSLADFGYDASKHSVHEGAAADAERPQLYLEDVYVEILTAAKAGADLKITNSHEVVVGANDDAQRNWRAVEAGTYADRYIKKGDIAVIAPQLAQVLYDPSEHVDFVRDQPKSVKVLTADNNLQGEAFDVAKIIDKNRLLLTEQGNKLAGIAEGNDSTALGYSIHTVTRATAADANRIGAEVADGTAVIKRPSPEAIAIESVDLAGDKIVLARDVPWQSLDTHAVKVRIERKIAPYSASQPGYLLADSFLDRVDASKNVGTHGVLQVGSQPTIPFGGGNLKVTRARAFISWRGLRTSISDIKTVGSIPVSGEFADLGRISPKNPLALAAAVCLDNAGATNISVLPIVSPGSAGFSAARPKLNSAEDLYCIVPLSTDLTNVILPLKNDAVSMSAPEKSLFRMVVGASEGLPLVRPLASGTANANLTAAALNVPSADFLSAGVAVNDKVVWDGDATNHTFYVSEVVNAQNLVLKDKPEALVADGGTAALIDLTEASKDYEISRDISTDSAAQVDALKDRLTSVADKRLTMVYPGVCTARGFSGQPGYYLSAALGGVIAGTNPHRPKNQLGIAGIDQIFESNLKFSDDEIDELGDGGYFVFIQDSVTGAPFTPHQVTTGQIASPGVQEFAELSVVTNFDFVSKIFKVRMDPYVGVWNVIPEAIESIRGSLEGGIADLASRSAPRIGAPLIAGTVSSVAVDEADAGRINVAVEVQIPKVLNKLVVHLTSA